MMRLIRILLAVLLALPVVLFVLSNRGVVTLRLWPLPGGVDLPLAVAGLALAAIGFLLGALVVWLSVLPGRLRAGSDRRVVEAQERTSTQTMPALR